MSRKAQWPPPVYHHKPSGKDRLRVYINRKPRDYNLGPTGSKEARQEYRRLLADLKPQWLADQEARRRAEQEAREARQVAEQEARQEALRLFLDNWRLESEAQRQAEQEGGSDRPNRIRPLAEVDPNRVYNLKDAAEYIPKCRSNDTKVRPQTLRRWLKEGLVDGLQRKAKVRTSWFIQGDQILRLLRHFGWTEKPFDRGPTPSQRRRDYEAAMAELRARGLKV